MRIPQWKCRACGAWRPDTQISVKSLDISQAWGFREGTLKENYCYCNDRVHCITAAELYQGRKPPEKT